MPVARHAKNTVDPLLISRALGDNQGRHHTSPDLLVESRVTELTPAEALCQKKGKHERGVPLDVATHGLQGNFLGVLIHQTVGKRDERRRRRIIGDVRIEPETPARRP